MTKLNCYVPRKQRLDQAFYFYRRNPDSVMAQRSQKARIRIFTSCRNAAAELLKLQSYYEEGINQTDIANAYMTMIWHGVNAICEMPLSERRVYMRNMKELHLFPCTRMDACSLTKSYTTSRTDRIGKMYDWIYVHLHTRFGFRLMCIWRDLERLKKRKDVKNVLIMADYRTRNSGNFIASIIELAKRIQANGGKMVYIAPHIKCLRGGVSVG